MTPPAAVWATAPAKVRQGAARVHGLESLPDVAETQVRPPDESPLLVNAADTLLNIFMVSMQAPVPLHAPPQPIKLAPAAWFAVSVTGVPLLKFALQVAPQLMPAGELVTEPSPVTLTDSVNVDC